MERPYRTRSDWFFRGVKYLGGGRGQHGFSKFREFPGEGEHEGRFPPSSDDGQHSSRRGKSEGFDE